MPEVSVVIPSKNEEKTISACVEKLKKIFSDHHIDGEIIVADNSADKTPEIAAALGARVVTPDKLTIISRKSTLKQVNILQLLKNVSGVWGRESPPKRNSKFTNYWGGLILN